MFAVRLLGLVQMQGERVCIRVGDEKRWDSQYLCTKSRRVEAFVEQTKRLLLFVVQF